uniref:Uncharacterized protein n=1 Tax=Rhizophora mucronata TaxID=61149 RepID=A0A2P2P6E6_RHIMU
MNLLAVRLQAIAWLGSLPTCWTPSAKITPMPMCKCGSMWQWKGQTPGLSVTNLSAVHP